MRPKNMEASLGEIMGKAADSPSMTLADLPDIIGKDKMIEMPRNKVGRHRLIRALQGRFGNGYRHMPGVSGLIKEFDEDIKYEALLEKIRMVQPKGK